MEFASNLYGSPIRSLQTFLREISYYYTGIPTVIPDGIFGESTKDAVIAFQTAFNIPKTGEVDFDCWQRITEVFEKIAGNKRRESDVRVMPDRDIFPYEKSDHLYTLQSVLYALSKRFGNLGNIQVSGVHDPKSVAVVKKIQALSSLPQTGVIDKPTWSAISKLYRSNVSNNRIDFIK